MTVSSSKWDLPYCHLHLHSDHSMLDGVGRSAEYVELAAKMGQKAIAITDHGNLYGLPAHKAACESAGIKPIFGIECYAVDDRDKAKEQKKQARRDKTDKALLDPTFVDAHIVLLAESNAGWANLLKLNHEAVRDGYYYQPRTTHDLICSHAEGLICTTACMGSLFSRLALKGDIPRLRALLGKFKAAFGDRFYHALHFNEIPEQKDLNATMLHECARLGIQPIVECDVHYACSDDADRQDEMTAVARRAVIGTPEHFAVSARHLWFAGPREIAAHAAGWGYAIDPKTLRDAIARTAEVADRCNATIYGDGALRPPRYLRDDGTPAPDPFAALVEATGRGYRETVASSVRARDPGKLKVYEARVRHELRVIRACGMADFYMVTADIAAFCRSRKILCWLRGSGCASLVAACLGISQVDPIEFGLLFERFVDPSRPNAPDFDLDIDSSRRDEVVAWLEKKYGGPGGERIARIISLQTFGLRSALRDVCFARGAPADAAFGFAKVTDLLPTLPGRAVPEIEHALQECPVADRQKTIDRAVVEILKVAPPAARNYAAARPEVIRAACTMVGRVRGRGMHAAGYVVGPDALVNHLPIDRQVSGADGQYMTAWGEGQADQHIAATGLMKIDLLSLETLRVVTDCVNAASRIHGRDVWAEINTWGMDWADPAVRKEYESGVGYGLHQLNGDDQSLAQFTRKLKPRSVHDIVAAVAMYRPGSLSFLDEYLLRAHGRQEVPAVHPIYDEELAETHGIIVYQEQIMRILHRLGDIPLREAYTIIKAVSKKNDKKIKAAREEFVANAGKGHGLAADAAGAIFDLIEKFAGYGFNKCLLGDTQLFLAGKNAANPTGTTTIAEAYRAWHSETDLGKKMRAGQWRVLQMDADGRVRPGYVKAVIYQGRKPVVRIETAGGRMISVTRNHRLLTTRGYVVAGEIRSGDALVCMVENQTYPAKAGPPESRKGKLNRYTYQSPGGGFPSGPAHPGWSDGRTLMLTTAKAAVAARSGGVCESCGETGGRMEYAHTRSFEACGGHLAQYHHEDNLRLLCNPCHKTFDYAKGERVAAWSKGRPTHADPVVAVTDAGTGPVYDLEMATEEHNFVANGVVSHNSHAASYGLLSWVTAYLRAKYPTEFWWAWLNATPNETGNKAKGGGKHERRCERMMRQAQRCGIRLLGPRVGQSGPRWKILKSGALLAPLSILIGVGESAAQAAHEAYRAHPWPDIWAFLRWAECHKKLLNGRALLACAQAGALAGLGVGAEEATDLIGYWTGSKASKANGSQTDQASRMHHDPAAAAGTYTTVPSGEMRMVLERKALGFLYWSDAWSIGGRRGKALALTAAGRVANEADKRLHGKRRAFAVTGCRLHVDKKGKQMAFLTLMTPGAETARGVVFGSVWAKCKRSVKIDGAYLVAGSYDRDGAFLVDGRVGRPFIALDAVPERALAAV